MEDPAKRKSADDSDSEEEQTYDAKYAEEESRRKTAAMSADPKGKAKGKKFPQWHRSEKRDLWPDKGITLILANSYKAQRDNEFNSITNHLIRMLATLTPEAVQSHITGCGVADEGLVTAISKAAKAASGNDKDTVLSFAVGLHREGLDGDTIVRVMLPVIDKYRPLDIPYVRAAMDPENIRRWFVVVTGSTGDFEGGEIAMTLIAPDGYPNKPPHFYVHTETGIYQPHEKTCVTGGEFHSDEYIISLGMEGFGKAVVLAVGTWKSLIGGIGVIAREDSGKAIRACAAHSAEYNATHLTDMVEYVNSMSFAMQLRRVVNQAAVQWEKDKETELMERNKAAAAAMASSGVKRVPARLRNQ